MKLFILGVCNDFSRPYVTSYDLYVLDEDRTETQNPTEDAAGFPFGKFRCTI